MQELFKEIIKNEVKPLFTRHGYTKKGLNFRRVEGDLIYGFNIQKSQGNTANHVRFYINCMIHSKELAELQSMTSGGKTMGEQVHLTCRIEEIVPSAPDRYSLTHDTDPITFSKELLSDLEDAVEYMKNITSAREIVEYYIAETALHLSEETFHFLLQNGDTTTAQKYLQQLQAKYGAENRWAIFQKKYAAIFAEFGMQFILQDV
ncbi:protein of unknown function [Paenibacillus polysaccharolyticus]|uniref:DUF4304 domain-containing protein n=1 Tax=Paenibacillus polysaccharolyticus TaxID=582692 RepID=A0A1G5JL72_9BACL|nr:DUF4304 domain-containing protein [Paenibacillus polysaccharolyticus]SCY88671.1 protein of unknown function [Paenibacillus polysaccharolyticus]